MTESQIQSNIIERLRRQGWWVTKIIQTSTNGIPDVMAIRGGRVVFIEVKRPGQKPTPLQVYRQKQLQEQGVEVYTTSDKSFTL